MIIIITDKDCEKLIHDVVKLIMPHGIKISDTKHGIDTKLPHNQETSEQNGSVKYKAIQLLKSGRSAEEVARATGLREAVVRAYKAHLTMGTYK